ncbi:class V lanthionine synthetase subunit LxmK [Allokutzneria sp. NRRL B-24872]|uniref:class V lanthionine synthetase subunit LxmK n=1 Tax=Allokutzneria sp. NRRL B-24872 TaxID=1137961 RepID=UPI000A3B1A8F|nr:class V lanthionine synthetase subunit LxmK [Allokutzneria sp. NRRL B-24872]
MTLVERVVLTPTDAPEAAAVALAELGLGALVPDTVVAFTGRNDNWAGTTDSGARVFVKRVAEAAALTRAHSFEVVSAGLRRLRSPRLLGAAQGLQVFELIEDANTGAELAADDSFTDGLASSIGEAIGELHGAAADVERTVLAMPPLRRFTSLTVAEYTAMSGGELEFWRLVQRDSRLHAALSELRADEAAAEAVPIHGDLRLDQLLVRGEEAHITDWEEFRLGDAARDIGSFAGEWVLHAMNAIVEHSDSEELAHEDVLARGVEELTLRRPLISAFWRAYVRQRPVTDPALPVRATAFAGWHLFDRMLAVAQQTHELPATARAAAGVGRQMILSPQRFLATVGLEEPVCAT